MFPMRRLAWAGVPFLRVRGIPVEAHWSLTIFVVFLAGNLAASRYLGRYPELSQTTITGMTIASALLFPATILLHEFGHAFQARREGMRVERITLWFFGGIAWLSGQARSPGADFRVTAAGPLVTASLAGLFGALAWIGQRTGWPDVVVGVAVWLAQIQVVVFVLNLLPIFPLDGGRIFHSVLLRLRGPEFAATWAKRVAVAMASLLVAIGMVGPFVGVLPPPFISPRALIDSSSLLFFGLFVLWLTTQTRELAPSPGSGQRRLTVGDLLGPRFVPAAGETVGAFLASITRMEGYRTSAFPVLERGEVVGVVSPGLADQVPAEGRGETTVAEVMLRKADAVVLDPQTPIDDAYQALQAGSGRGVVLDGDRVTGVLSLADLADVLLRIKDGRQGAMVSGSSSRPAGVKW